MWFSDWHLKTELKTVLNIRIMNIGLRNSYNRILKSVNCENYVVYKISATFLWFFWFCLHSSREYGIHTYKLHYYILYILWNFNLYLLVNHNITVLFVFEIKFISKNHKPSLKTLYTCSWNFHGCFLHKDYALNSRFREFPSCSDPFLECQRFMNFAVHFIRAKSSLILLLALMKWTVWNIGILKMDLNTEETHNLYIIYMSFCSYFCTLLKKPHYFWIFT